MCEFDKSRTRAIKSSRKKLVVVVLVESSLRSEISDEYERTFSSLADNFFETQDRSRSFDVVVHDDDDIVFGDSIDEIVENLFSSFDESESSDGRLVSRNSTISNNSRSISGRGDSGEYDTSTSIVRGERFGRDSTMSGQSTIIARALPFEQTDR